MRKGHAMVVRRDKSRVSRSEKADVNNSHTSHMGIRGTGTELICWYRWDVKEGLAGTRDLPSKDVSIRMAGGESGMIGRDC
jgi:hypothetical protein